jgi:hypothetical protein
MADDTLLLTDHQGLKIRLTAERLTHLLEHPEMDGQFEKIAQTLAEPETIIATNADESVHVYHRYYELTPVTSKFMQVAVKVLPEDAFILTAFFSRREKKGTVLWKA